MNRWIQILVVHSGKELFKYKSFFLLVFVLILLDRILRQYLKVDKSNLQIPNIRELGLNVAPYVFEELPSRLWDFLTDPRTFLIILGLFLLKQLISMWPSSDMRRMHREERESFGLIHSLLALKWDQLLWDAIAVASIVGVVTVWGGFSFGFCLIGWKFTQSPIWLLLLGSFVFMATPILLAGFSYSSKLAVLSQGNFAEKLWLFFQIFINPQIAVPTWIFYLLRIIIELLFVAIIPLIAIVSIENFFLRIAVAGLSATPVYSYLKMASFKFFLEMYREYPQVQREYQDYFEQMR